MVEINFNQTAGAEIQCRNDIAVEVEVQIAVPFAFAASRRELGSMKEAILTAAYQTLAAYIVGTIIFQVGSLIF